MTLTLPFRHEGVRDTVARGVWVKLVLKANRLNECVGQNTTHWGKSDEGGWDGSGWRWGQEASAAWSHPLTLHTWKVDGPTALHHAWVMVPTQGSINFLIVGACPLFKNIHVFPASYCSPAVNCGQKYCLGWPGLCAMTRRPTCSLPAQLQEPRVP